MSILITTTVSVHLQETISVNTSDYIGKDKSNYSDYIMTLQLTFEKFKSSTTTPSAAAAASARCVMAVRVALSSAHAVKKRARLASSAPCSHASSPTNRLNHLCHVVFASYVCAHMYK